MAVMSSLSGLQQIQMQQQRQRSSRDLGEIKEEGEETVAVRCDATTDDRICVAVGKESKSTVEWAARNAEGKNAGGQNLVLLHVNQPAQLIPMLMGGRFPPDRVSPLELRAYRETERVEMNKMLQEYKLICARRRVQVDELVINMDDVEKGILQLVAQHGINKLVMGAAADKHYSSCKKTKQPKSKKAIAVAQEVNRYCHMWFICKGELICTRETRLDGTVEWVSPPSPETIQNTPVGEPSSSRLRSSSLQSPSRGQVDRPSRLTNPFQELFRSKSENYASRAHRKRAEHSRRTMPEIPTTVEDNMNNQWDGISPSPVSSMFSASDEGASSTPPCSIERDDQSITSRSASTERDDQSEGGSLILPTVNESEDGPISSAHNELEEEGIDDDHLYKQLQQAMEEANTYWQETYKESDKRRKAEKHAFEMARKAKTSESLYAKEMRVRKEMEELLRQEKQQLKNVNTQRLEVLEELQRSRDQKLELEAQIAGSNRLVSELKENLSTAEKLLSMLQRERDELQKERDEVISQAEELQKRKEGAAEASSSSRSPPDFSEFGFTELEAATSGFDVSLKIGEGGYGSVFKGVLRHTPVAVKMLHPHSMQGLSEFQQEVDVLSKVRHPNLVTLIGTCTEAGALIYEYLSNGSLEDRLSCKDNSPPLSWQARTRIAADICSALIFLHSSTPHSIVHGDLKPANILLGPNYVAKLGDFGICRLIPQKNSATTAFLRTDPKGTFAYMDPEFQSTGLLTTRSDVYSFGVVILRLLTAKPAMGIVKLVNDALENCNLQRVLDGTAGDWPFVHAKQLAQIGLSCCQMDRKSRPDLVSEVWRLLEPMTAFAGLASSSFRLTSRDHGRIPSYFICPIFLEIMRDPQVAADGFTYEAEAIRGWLDSGHNTSPVTNARLVHTDLIPNRGLKSSIQEWLQQS